MEQELWLSSILEHQCFASTVVTASSSPCLFLLDSVSNASKVLDLSFVYPRFGDLFAYHHCLISENPRVSYLL